MSLQLSLLKVPQELHHSVIREFLVQVLGVKEVLLDMLFVLVEQSNHGEVLKVYAKLVHNLQLS